MRGLFGHEMIYVLVFFVLAGAAFGSFYLFADRMAHPDSLLGRSKRTDLRTRSQASTQTRLGDILWMEIDNPFDLESCASPTAAGRKRTGSVSR